jgi:hypothetical protein
MKQIFHHYELWEDYKCGFYNNCSGEQKKELIKKVVDIFSNENLTRKYMEKVISEWKYSLEHNLTNPSINKIAYIGQSACAIAFNIPNTITMEAWRYVSIENRNKADKIALESIKKWKESNKEIQLCLNMN